MPEGFSVYLNELGYMANYLEAASQELVKVGQTANGPARRAANALGKLGEVTNFAMKYNEACDLVRDRASAGAIAMHAAALELVSIEKEYAAKEDYWAKQFGIMNDGGAVDIPSISGETQKQVK